MLEWYSRRCMKDVIFDQSFVSRNVEHVIVLKYIGIIGQLMKFIKEDFK